MIRVVLDYYIGFIVIEFAVIVSILSYSYYVYVNNKIKSLLNLTLDDPHE